MFGDIYGADPTEIVDAAHGKTKTDPEPAGASSKKTADTAAADRATAALERQRQAIQDLIAEQAYQLNANQRIAEAYAISEEAGERMKLQIDAEKEARSAALDMMSALDEAKKAGIAVTEEDIKTLERATEIIYKNSLALGEQKKNIDAVAEANRKKKQAQEKANEITNNLREEGEQVVLLS